MVLYIKAKKIAFPQEYFHRIMGSICFPDDQNNTQANFENVYATFEEYCSAILLTHHTFQATEFK